MLLSGYFLRFFAVELSLCKDKKMSDAAHFSA